MTTAAPQPPPPPADLVALPELAGFLAAVRGQAPCRRCGGAGEVALDEAPGGHCRCYACAGSGRAPPDPAAAAQLADFLAERGADDAQVCRLVALPPAWEGRTPDGAVGWFPLHQEHDDSLLPLLAAWDCVQAGFAPPCPACGDSGGCRDGCACHVCGDASAAARRRARAGLVRGLRLRPDTGGRWCVVDAAGACLPAGHALPGEPAARRARKRHALGLYADVRIPMRAEGRRLTVGNAPGLTLIADGEPRYSRIIFGQPFVSAERSSAYFLDGNRVGGPPDWAWTPWRVPCGVCGGGDSGRGPVLACPGCGGAGTRLLVTWTTTPAGLLPEGGRPAEVIDHRPGGRYGTPPGARRP